jgi:hypothetical protein
LFLSKRYLSKHLSTLSLKISSRHNFKNYIFFFSAFELACLLTVFSLI